MRFFTSDPHFGHKNIISFCNRPWDNIENMERGLILRWNKTVQPEDDIYILGDMFFCGVGRAKGILNQLNGRKHLILGNHDWDLLKITRKDEFGFASMQDTMTLEIASQIVNLSHFPYKGEGDHTDYPRFNEKRLDDDGKWLIHGHVHHFWKTKKKMINVGVDVWNWHPISEQQIAEIMNVG